MPAASTSGRRALNPVDPWQSQMRCAFARISGKRLRVGHVFFRILERGEQNLRALERATLQVIPDRHRAFRERIRELLAETKRPLLDVLVAAATLRATARRHLDRMFEFWLHGNPASCYQYLSE